MPLPPKDWGTLVKQAAAFRVGLSSSSSSSSSSGGKYLVAEPSNSSSNWGGLTAANGVNLGTSLDTFSSSSSSGSLSLERTPRLQDYQQATLLARSDSYLLTYLQLNHIPFSISVSDTYSSSEQSYIQTCFDPYSMALSSCFTPTMLNLLCSF